MSLCDYRGIFANDKEVARRRSVSREPQALLVCESLIQRRAASRDSDEVIHKKHREACRRINQWFLNTKQTRNDVTIKDSESKTYIWKGLLRKCYQIKNLFHRRIYS